MRAVTSEERHQRIISHGDEDIIPLCLALPFLLLFCHVTIPRTSLSSPCLFWSQSECLSPFGPMWDWPQPSSDHLPQRCFLREMPECFTGCATESQTLTTTLQATVIAAWKWQQFAEVHLWPLRLTTEQNQRSVIINFRAHLAMALPILQADCDSHVWQCSTKIITKLLENDSQSVDRHTDRHYFPAEYFSAWRKH